VEDPKRTPWQSTASEYVAEVHCWGSLLLHTESCKFFVGFVASEHFSASQAYRFSAIINAQSRAEHHNTEATTSLICIGTPTLKVSVTC